MNIYCKLRNRFKLLPNINKSSKKIQMLAAPTKSLMGKIGGSVLVRGFPAPFSEGCSRAMATVSSDRTAASTGWTGSGVAGKGSGVACGGGGGVSRGFGTGVPTGDGDGGGSGSVFSGSELASFDETHSSSDSLPPVEGGGAEGCSGVLAPYVDELVIECASSEVWSAADISEVAPDSCAPNAFMCVLKFNFYFLQRSDLILFSLFIYKKKTCIAVFDSIFVTTGVFFQLYASSGGKFNMVVVLQNICNIIFWKLCYRRKKRTLYASEVFKREQRVSSSLLPYWVWRFLYMHRIKWWDTAANETVTAEREINWHQKLNFDIILYWKWPQDEAFVVNWPENQIATTLNFESDSSSHFMHTIKNAYFLK